MDTYIPTKNERLQNNKVNSSKNIAIVGSGIAGLSAAWILSKTHQVTLYEKADKLGGHSNTININYSRDNSEEVLDWVLSLFPALKSRLKQKSGTLSGGEQQMVATARALCLKPKYLLMDEPSEGLMPSMIETILKTIDKLKKENVGILLVEQKIEGILRVSDRIAFIENGFIRDESDPQKLKKNPESLEKYVGLKAKK